MDTHGNGTHDVITPLAALIREIARTHNPQHLCTDMGSERAALHINVGLAARGYSLERLWRRTQ